MSKKIYFSLLPLLVVLCACVLFSPVQGSCQKQNLCCKGRDNKCWTYGEPMNAANYSQGTGNNTDDADVIAKSQKRCFCDEGCSVLNDCCIDYPYVCRRK